MWQPYLDAIREKCSQAPHILDRFHIVAKRMVQFGPLAIRWSVKP